MTEVGFYMTVEAQEDNVYVITNVMLPPQYVSMASVHISEEFHAEYQKRIENRFGKEKAAKITNTTRAHGHSHVNMSTAPSSVDEDDFKERNDGCVPYYVRLIVNKREDFNIDFFDYKKGIVYLDIGLTVQFDEERRAFWEKELKECIRERPITVGSTHKDYMLEWKDELITEIYKIAPGKFTTIDLAQKEPEELYNLKEKLLMGKVVRLPAKTGDQLDLNVVHYQELCSSLITLILESEFNLYSKQELELLPLTELEDIYKGFNIIEDEIGDTKWLT